MMVSAPIRIWVMWSENSADFALSVTSCNAKGEPQGQLTHSIKVGDENINQRLTDIIQSFRMGLRHQQDTRI